MIAHQLINVLPNIANGRLISLAFTVTATDGDIIEKIDWYTPCSLPDREAPYTQTDYVDLAGSIAAAQELYSTLNALVEAKNLELLPVTPVPGPAVQLTDAERKAAWIKQVDDYIAAIITKAMRFQMGYLEREAEAIRYRASGYAGLPNTWIMDFANEVHMPARMATDIILSQAVKLRKDNKELESLRMKKYGVAKATTMELAEAKFNHIMRAAAAIEKTI